MPALSVGIAGGTLNGALVARHCPNLNKDYVHAGVQLAQGTLAAGAISMDGGRLGKIEIRGSEIILGPPLKFTKANIDKFNF